MFDINRIKELLEYNPETGELKWKDCCRKSIRNGSTAGHISKNNGYIRLKIDKREFRAHRVAWAIFYGKWPEYEIDHINRIRSDNRICNLRDVNHFVNMRNRSDAKHLK